VKPGQGSHHTLKGVLFALAGTLCLSTVPVTSKLVLADLPSLQFSALWMLFSTGWSLVWLIAKERRSVSTQLRARWRSLLLMGAFATGWVFFYFRGLEALSPPVATFLMNSRIVWAVVIGAAFLGERYTLLQLAGIGAVAIGVVVVFSDVEPGGEVTGYMWILLSALFLVLTSTVVRHQKRVVSVELLLVSRFLLPALALAVLALLSGPVPRLGARALLLIAGGSFIGPFLSFLFIYTSLTYLRLGIQSALQSMVIVFTTVLSFVVFGTVPPVNELAGGAIIFVGVLAVGLASSARRKRISRVS
jgi:drug/metabolite transporter (DMT)-like permease